MKIREGCRREEGKCVVICRLKSCELLSRQVQTVHNLVHGLHDVDDIVVGRVPGFGGENNQDSSLLKVEFDY